MAGPGIPVCQEASLLCFHTAGWGGNYWGGVLGAAAGPGAAKMRFDLRAEVELPSPSARVTHQGCVEEADPEGLKPQLGQGRGEERQNPGDRSGPGSRPE